MLYFEFLIQKHWFKDSHNLHKITNDYTVKLNHFLQENDIDINRMEKNITSNLDSQSGINILYKLSIMLYQNWYKIIGNIWSLEY